MVTTKRTSLLCPNCKKLISSDEPTCPHCGISRPGSWWKNLPIQSYVNADNIIRIIIVTNVTFFALSVLLSAKSSTAAASPFALLSPSNQILFLLGATGTIPIGEFHRWWTLIAASYLHGGIFHILFNMMAVSQIAPFVLREYGLNRMLMIYTLGGGFGFLVSYLAGVSFSIGASASLCALIGAALYYGKSRGGFYGETVFKQLMGWVVGIFLFGFLVPGINNWGHGGGILSGVLLGWWLGYSEKKKETTFHKLPGPLCIVLTAVALLRGIISACYHLFFA